MKTAKVGRIIYGISPPEETIPALMDALASLDHPGAEDFRLFWAELEKELVIDADGWPTAPDDATWHNHVYDIITACMDMLNECAPDYCEFRALDGNDSDYGFYPVTDFLEYMRDDGVEVVSDLSEIEPRTVAHVNDHGNVTYGIVDSDGFRELWAVT